jgi:D-arabinose 1-dehydrogenase-like Zn-dependent alcohol dehydrogenase
MVLGHEGIGVVLQIGPEVRMLRKGDRVGWGYQHDSCGLCQVCLEGDEVHCDTGEVYGDSNLDQGAFATNVIWREAHLLRIPDDLSDVDAAPLMCAGNTVFSALATMNLTQGAKVGVLGMGGLGHLAVQFAAKQGFRVTVLSRTEEKEKDALELGAKDFHLFNDLPGLPLGEALDALLITASHLSGNVAFLSEE